MDKADDDDGAEGSGIKPDNEADQLMQQAFPDESFVNHLRAVIKLSKQIYTELAVKNILAELTDELVDTNIGDKIDSHASTSLEEELKHVSTRLEEKLMHAPTSLEEELKADPHAPTCPEEELKHAPTCPEEELKHAPTCPEEELKPDPNASTSLEEELKPDPHASTSLKAELKPDPYAPTSPEEELAPYVPTSPGEELDPKCLSEELNTSSSQQLEYLLIHSKADNNSETVTNESCEPNTSDLLEQIDAKPEQIIKEELEHIFKHTFDSVAQKIDGNLETDFPQSGDSFQDLELSEIWHNKKLLDDDEPRAISSAEFYTSPNHSPVVSPQAVLLSTPLDEFTLMDKLDVSGAIKVGRSEEVINLAPQLLRIIQKSDNWDIMIFVGNYKFRCHMLALQMYSPYFRRFKTSQTYAIRLPSKWVTPQAFKIVYNWIMQEEGSKLMSFSNRRILETYSAAQFLGITDLINTVCQSFDKLTNEDEIYSLLPDVFHLGIPMFEQLFVTRISRFFLTLVASQEFVKMKARHVKLLLASQNIGVNCEIEVVYAAVRWLNHEWPKRRIHVPDMMSSVRFSLLPPMFLRFLQRPQKTRVLHEIFKCPLVIEEINKAFVYTSSTLLYKGPHAVLEFQLPAFEVPEHRKWLYDPECAHHRKIICDMRQFFTYAQFLQYLETLHHSEPKHWKTLQYLEDCLQSCPC